MKPIPKCLYDYPISGNGYKIRIALAHLGFSVEYKIVDLLNGEAGMPEFLSKNPMGQIPVLELSDGTCLTESNAILFWLTEGTELLPDELLAKTRVIQWMCFEQSNIDKVLGRTRFLKRYPHVLDTTQKDWDQWYATGYRALGVLEKQLRDHAFLVGNKYSAADICLYGYVHSAEDGGFDLAHYPNVSRWRSEVRARVKYTIDEVGERFPPGVN